MLKIKDNVDLKELEKYGFELNDDGEYQLTIEKNNCRTICVVENSRTIYIQSIGYVVQELDFLYNLIKDNLVERVEDE